MFSKIVRILAHLQRSFLIVVAMMVALGMFGEVVLRLANLPLFTLEDTILYSVGWLYFIGVASATANRSHIKADILPIFIKNPRKLELLRGLVTLISVGIMILLCITSFKYIMWVIATGEKSVSLGISTAYAAGSMVVGFTLASLYFLIEAFEHIGNYLRGNITLQ